MLLGPANATVALGVTVTMVELITLVLVQPPDTTVRVMLRPKPPCGQGAVPTREHVTVTFVFGGTEAGQSVMQRQHVRNML